MRLDLRIESGRRLLVFLFFLAQEALFANAFCNLPAKGFGSFLDEEFAVCRVVVNRQVNNAKQTPLNVDGFYRCQYLFCAELVCELIAGVMKGKAMAFLSHKPE